MLRLSRTYRERVSNRTAVLAVCLLVAAAVAGFNAPSADTVNDIPSVAGASNESATPTQSVRTVNARKGLKFNFYLFRHK